MRKSKRKPIVVLPLAVILAAGLWGGATAIASDPFIGEIQPFGFNFAPRSWTFCDGQLLPISQNTALYSLLGTIYGGDGRTNFAVPDLRGRVAIGQGRGPGLTDRRIGARGGASQVVLVADQLPTHTHAAELNATSNAGDADTPGTNKVLARDNRDEAYSASAPDVSMTAAITVDPAGGGQPHNNMPPYLGVRYSIAVVGTYPSRN